MENNYGITKTNNNNELEAKRINELVSKNADYDITETDDYGNTEKTSRINLSQNENYEISTVQNNNASSYSGCTALVPYIVIDKSELDTNYVRDRLREEREAKVVFNEIERIPVKNNILLNPVFYTAICGLIAALIGWSAIEPFVNKLDGALMYMTILIMALLGSSISSVDALLSGNFIKTLKTGSIGLVIGLIWGVVGLFTASYFMYWLKDLISIFIRPDFLPNSFDFAITLKTVVWAMLARTPAWTLLGLGIGAIPGIANFSKKLLHNGIVGGVIGGFIGGFLFDPIAFSSVYTTGALSRAIGMAALSTSIGIFVGLVENMAKDVWVTMKSGPLKGKQFVIYHNPTLIGSSPKSDIYIFKDPNVMPTHAKIQKKGSKYEIIIGNKDADIYVNSKKINKSKILENNDVIVVGKSILEFKQKDKL